MAKPSPQQLIDFLISNIAESAAISSIHSELDSRYHAPSEDWARHYNASIPYMLNRVLEYHEKRLREIAAIARHDANWLVNIFQGAEDLGKSAAADALRRLDTIEQNIAAVLIQKDGAPIKAARDYLEIIKRAYAQSPSPDNDAVGEILNSPAREPLEKLMSFLFPNVYERALVHNIIGRWDENGLREFCARHQEQLGTRNPPEEKTWREIIFGDHNEEGPARRLF